MPTQKTASVPREPQVTAGSLQLPVTVLNVLLVSAYPAQLVLCTWVRPRDRDECPTAWSVACWPMDRCRIAARAAARACAYAAAEEAEEEVAALAPGETAMTRPSTGAQAAIVQVSKRGMRRCIRSPLGFGPQWPTAHRM